MAGRAQNAAVVGNFVARNLFLTWHNAHINSFEMEWELNQGLIA